MEAGVVVGQASSSNRKHSSRSNVNAIAGHKRSSTVAFTLLLLLCFMLQQQ